LGRDPRSRVQKQPQPELARLGTPVRSEAANADDEIADEAAANGQRDHGRKFKMLAKPRLASAAAVAKASLGGIAGGTPPPPSAVNA
jgi:hypothetical protein